MTVSASRVALVGSACRLPSARGLDAFWDVLINGRCVITELDEDRFGTRQHLHPDRARPGRAVTFAAGQVEAPFAFDPSYFGISPREAQAMDPQQRILLEVVVEALENAGIPADKLAGEKVGVYVGASSIDYGTHAQLDTASIEPQSMTGNTLSIIANRVSYVFDLRGPSYVVDTACSSSLIALHHAMEDIRLGRIDTAIVGGVSLLLHPVPFIGFSRAQMLSANGLCRAFDAGADGYVRSEGAVALVLRSDKAARASGDHIRARFVASGINADGRTAGLSLPSMEAQAALLEEVYAKGGIDPNRLAFMEAHGTGTRVGDPIEAEAIGRVVATKRDAPLLIGSSKTNFGHLEPASGLVGVLKSQLALANDALPASLHFDAPNPDIRFAELNLTVAAEATPLARGDEPRLAGINSFGFGGANAHVVVEDGEPVAPASGAPVKAPLVVSAASKAALAALAGATADRLAGGADARRYANAVAYRRQRLPFRAVIAPAEAGEMGAALAAVAKGEEHSLAITGEASVAAEKPVFVYSGNGSQWAGMGRVAYQSETDFRLSFDRTDRVFMSVAGWSLVTMLFSEDLDVEIERTEIAQPLLFALQVAMTEALHRQGLSPSLVMGHSVGEVAAAWASGALSLSDAVRVIHARSTHQEVTRHLGGMAALLLPPEEARAAIAPFAGLELAAINSNRSVTISGPMDSLAAFGKAARAKRWAVKRLDLDYPFHCALVEPIREPLMGSLEAIGPRECRVPMISTVTGGPIAGPELDAHYWWENVRRPVLFREGVVAALADHRLFLEIGPRAVLTTYMTDAARSASLKATVFCSFRQNDPDTGPIGTVVRNALANGAAVDDVVVFGAKRAGPDLLPNYPWQHDTYRHAVSVERVRLDAKVEHVLLGTRLRIDDRDWRSFIDTKSVPFLADHKVESAVVFPAAGFTEMILSAGRALHPGAPIELRNLDIFAPLVIDGDVERQLRTREIAPGTLLIESRPRLSEDGWTPHVKATVGKAPSAPAAGPALELPEGAATVPAAKLYEMTGSFGLPYGPVFRRASLVTLVDDAHAHVRLAPADPATQRYHFALDPTLFDSCFHALFAFLAGKLAGTDTAVLPIRVGRLVLAAEAGAPVEADIAIRLPTEGIVEADFTLRDGEGTVVAVATGVRFQAVPLSRATGGETLMAAPLLRRVTRAAEPATVRATLPADLVAEAGAEPSETALLVEAGVQAAAAEALAPLFSGAARIMDLVATGALAPSAAPLVARLLMALEASGAAEEAGAGWTVAERSIAVADVVSLLIAEYPERLAEAAILAALPEWLTAVMADGLAADGPLVAEALFDELTTDAPFSAPAFAALREMVRTTLDRGGDTAMRVCVLGASNMRFVRAVADLVDPARVSLVVSDRDQTMLERGRLVFERTVGVAFVDFEELASSGHPFDLMVLPPSLASVHLGDLARLMKPGGALIGAAYAPGLFADAVGGLEAAWWLGSADAENPIGRLVTAEEWTAALDDAGFSGSVMPLASGETDAFLFVAHGRGLEAVAAEEAAEAQTLPSLHAMGESARRVAIALSAMGEDVTVDDLSATPTGAALVAIDVPDPAELPVHLAELGAFLARLGTEARDVTLVTFGAQGVSASETRPSAAAVAAFGRVAINEFPHLQIRLVDIAPSFDASEAAVRLFAELAQPNAEREVVLSSDHRAAVRYVPAVPAPREAGEAKVLAIPRRGSIDHLEWQAAASPPLAPGEVRLKVEATGLNFRDVMWTLGLLPAEALQDGFAGPTLGMECAGIVEAVGEGVEDLGPGDPVIAFAPACFASHVTVRADAVARRPAALGPEAAATIPVAFLTAFYALVELGGLEEGETVLIHGGAGGVGLAALQIAKWRGAKVFATAGTTEKRALLTRLGADRVFDSRTLTFADETMAATGGEGVDMVLNSLAGEAMERSIDVLKPFGRFLELGKRDFYADTKLGLRPFRQNLSYFGIDADQLMKHRAKLAKRLLGTIIDLFEEGDFTPLPYRSFAAGAVRDAFRLMQSAGHIGKIIVEAPASERPAEVPVAAVVDPDKAYLLAGGTSGFGFATAEWLIGEGARHLVLASRSGVKDDTVEAAIARHREAGVEITVAALDVTDAAAVKALVDEIVAERPLGGMFHMAMVLDDALITSLDADRYATVLDPKIGGVLALEAATANMPLDLFVVYSSITVQLGNPGQANYVAANAFLEAVARRRRAEGKPGLAVAWGAIADVGVLSRDMRTSEILQKKLGRHAITAADALAGLKAMLDDGAMTSGPALRMIGKVDWAAARKDLALAQSPAFEDLADGSDGAGDEAGAIDLAERLKGLTDAEALVEVQRLLAGEISRILKLPTSEVDLHKPLTALGMDSLMGVELRMAAEQRLGIDIPLMSLAAGVTLTDLARKVVLRGRGEEAAPDEAAEALITRHTGQDAGRVSGELGELEAVVREKTAGMRTIIP
ncbi:type I polyketide synthase [Acuticoccus mangrovi]|uniref:SDR family NAD(P)-dependent oxidoreductase n=1 Tax=Acuticoccus mangrovi TaxID=2796142 RepID=A0A934ILU7_9HYPH|nr:type I polyketide synthase [Acuticoccus mangrovi]MBJ3776207.1 SDR family NAD(P)-dependent oxidoreductase [Acuticoccus mangrovi]